MLDAALEAGHLVGGPGRRVGERAVGAVGEPLCHGVGVGPVDGAPVQLDLAVARGLGREAGLRHKFAFNEIELAIRSPLAIDLCLDKELVCLPVCKPGYRVASIRAIKGIGLK